MKTKIKVTKKGASMDSNNWKEGQEIECHPNLAEDFIKRGIAINIDEELPIDEELETTKTKKSK